MIKLFVKLVLVCSLFTANLSNATLITSDLSQDNYVTYNGIDFAWASMVNAERFYVGVDSYNELLDPTFHSGWDYATDEQLGMLTALSGADLLALFTRQDGSYIHAFEYWNTVYDQVSNTENILSKEIRSHWSWSAPEGEVYDELSSFAKMIQFIEIGNTPLTDYETFYVRIANNAVNEPNPIPEPTSLMIFSLALMALVARKKLSK